MEVTIVGAGNGGKAAAADLTLAGHEITLFEFPEYAGNLQPIIKKGGLDLIGVGRTGFAKLKAITSIIEEAVNFAEIILVVTSAFANKPAAKAFAPYLKNGQIVILCPGSTLGSLEFLEVMKEAGAEANIKIADVNTLPYAARGSGPEVRLLLEVKKLWLSAFPAKDTPDVLKIFKQFYPQTEHGKNVLDVGLNNGNPIAHPAAALLNAGRIEYSQGEFYHYKEGITPHVTNVIQAMDNERLSLCKKMGYMALPTIERMYLMGYGITKTSLYEAYRTSPVFCGEHPIKGPDNVFDRYFVEDTMYGLVTWDSLGRIIGVETPTMDAVIHLISTLHQKDYYAQGERSLHRYGLEQLSTDEINLYLATGQLKK